eukprot:CAMPEP_0113904554 /NCGR_PEP_ID=MMETSP0780_2-20120614/23335_1 /TAXON_ID=652834 /ORGANISM="Palpitomonas bilix" /LENGTH=885 /DNA_ID=CAMNT_0000898213 /DNA_START=224 /DNA_END=2878 /DNA_ORIENTATION=+ /assembly_acc=CAM_ASM_000599
MLVSSLWKERSEDPKKKMTGEAKALSGIHVSEGSLPREKPFQDPMHFPWFRHALGYREYEEACRILARKASVPSFRKQLLKHREVNSAHFAAARGWGGLVYLLMMDPMGFWLHFSLPTWMRAFQNKKQTLVSPSLSSVSSFSNTHANNCGQGTTLRVEQEEQRRSCWGNPELVWERFLYPDAFLPSFQMELLFWKKAFVSLSHEAIRNVPGCDMEALVSEISRFIDFVVRRGGGRGFVQCLMMNPQFWFIRSVHLLLRDLRDRHQGTWWRLQEDSPSFTAALRWFTTKTEGNWCWEWESPLWVAGGPGDERDAGALHQCTQEERERLSSPMYRRAQAKGFCIMVIEMIQEEEQEKRESPASDLPKDIHTESPAQRDSGGHHTPSQEEERLCRIESKWLSEIILVWPTSFWDTVKEVKQQTGHLRHRLYQDHLWHFWLSHPDFINALNVPKGKRCFTSPVDGPPLGCDASPPSRRTARVQSSLSRQQSRDDARVYMIWNATERGRDPSRVGDPCGHASSSFECDNDCETLVRTAITAAEAEYFAHTSTKSAFRGDLWEDYQRALFVAVSLCPEGHRIAPSAVLRSFVETEVERLIARPAHPHTLSSTASSPARNVTSTTHAWNLVERITGAFYSDVPNTVWVFLAGLWRPSEWAKHGLQSLCPTPSDRLAILQKRNRALFLSLLLHGELHRRSHSLWDAPFCPMGPHSARILPVLVCCCAVDRILFSSPLHRHTAGGLSSSDFSSIIMHTHLYCAARCLQLLRIWRTGPHQQWAWRHRGSTKGEQRREFAWASTEWGRYSLTEKPGCLLESLWKDVGHTGLHAERDLESIAFFQMCEAVHTVKHWREGVFLRKLWTVAGISMEEELKQTYLSNGGPKPSRKNPFTW